LPWPSDDAYIIRRRRWDGAEFETIAQELDMKSDAVQKRHVRSIVKLGALMRRLEAGDMTGLEEDPLAGSGQ
jgi:DNA-directed RNA polymerase specialized sigma24 family protein